MSEPSTHERSDARVVVGVDGGGTGTRAVVLHAEGHELGRGVGPASLADPGQPEYAVRAVAVAVRAALRSLDPPLPDGERPAALWAGIAGAGRESTRVAVEAVLQKEGLADRTRVGTDVQAAFHDAFDRGPGILVLAGTGSVAFGRSEDGREARVGGWGSLLGDEGSGYAVGLEALKRVAREHDGRGAETNLRTRILRHLGLERADDLVHWTHTATKADIAALVPVVASSAAEGDAVAAEILVHAVEELEGHVLTILEVLGPWTHAPTLALAGGLLGPGGPLRRGMERVARSHRLPLVERELDAARGAAWMAMAMEVEAGGG